MARTASYKKVSVAPLTGPLDNRSSVDLMGFGSYRLRQNFATTAQNKMCRRQGWQKLLPEKGESNSDLHSQLLDILEECDVLGDHVRQPISYLEEVASSTGSRRLLAGTQRRLYSLDYNLGNWRVLSDSQGGKTLSDEPCPHVYFRSATVGDISLFTNGLDPVSYWVFDTPPEDCDSDATQPVQELLDLGITQASVIYAWRSVVFIGDVVQDNQRYESKLFFSDFDNPLSWSPDPGVSIAGYQELDLGERILAFKEMSDYLLVYTTRSIWQVSVVTTDEVFNFRKVYSEPAGSDACLRYRNTLVSTGSFHFYLGSDALYVYSLFYPKPERIQWANLATAVIFDDINSDLCDIHVAGHNVNDKELWFSWATSESDCPNKTLVINYEHSVADIVDHGFTAFTNFVPDTRPDIHSFLLENCVCTQEELIELGAFIKAAWYCEETDGPDCSEPPQSIYTQNPLVVGSNTTEDYTQEEADPDSLCSQLDGVTIDDLCHECATPARFVLASSSDYCLKQYGGVYYRERCVSFESCGEYQSDPYDSILRSGANNFGLPETWKEIDGFAVEFEAIPQVDPLMLNLRFGYAEQALDPNEMTSACQIIWRNQPPKPFQCANTKLPSQYLSENMKPGLGAYWPMFYEGKIMYWELKLSGTGGGGCISRVTMSIRPISRCE